MAANGSGLGLNPDSEKYGGQHLEKTQSVSIDPALFEKLFLNPRTEVKGDLRRTFGVPTPLALIGFAIALTPLSCALMGWRGSDQTKLGVATIGTYLWFGGFLVLLTGVLEFFLGNTFACTLFMGYGAWFLTYGATLQPFYQASGSYAATPTANLEANQAAGATTTGFTASFAFILVFMAVLSFVFLVCALRVNLVFVLVLVCAVMGFSFLAAATFAESEAIRMLGQAAALQQGGNAAAARIRLAAGESRLSYALKLVTGGGGCFFAGSMLTWYLILAIMLAIIDFPIQLPVVDLSTMIKGKSERDAMRKAKAA